MHILIAARLCTFANVVMFQTYTASLNLTVKPGDTTMEQELTAKSSGQSKKIAAQGCALNLLSQLFKLSLVEANPNSPNAPNKKKQPRQRVRNFSLFSCNFKTSAFYISVFQVFATILYLISTFVIN